MTVAYAELRHTSPSAVYLLGTLSVVQDGQMRAVPEGCKRLLAFVALHGPRVDRRFAAGSLWSDVSDDRAAGNLRSTLWRLRGAGITLIDSDKASLFLREQTSTDLGALRAWADCVLDGTLSRADLTVPDWTDMIGELLPGWYEEWVVFERERVRQRLLHAFEALSRILCEAGRFGEAIDVAMDAVRMEPLRESAHRVLANAHLAEGNPVEARRTYLRYRDLIRGELGVDPTWAFQEWLSRTCPVPERRGTLHEPTLPH